MTNAELRRPTEAELTSSGIRVGVWFTGEGDGRVAVMMGVFGGYHANDAERRKNRRAVAVVRKRLVKLGFEVDG